MAVEIFFMTKQVSTKESAGRGNRTRGRLHAKRTRFRSRYCARPGVQLKRAAKLITVIGLTTKHAVCRIAFMLYPILLYDE